MSVDTTLEPAAPEIRPGRPRRRWRALGYVAGGIAALGAVAWAGLQVQPSPLADAGIEPGDVDTVPLPETLPAPVARFYATLYGDEVPVVTSAVISGRGEMRIAGVTFPARYRFSHVTGQDYRHYIELTVFGQRVTAVNEWFVDGHGRMELPFGVSEGPNVDQGANLALWAEAVWMPSLWVTDPAARWSAVDATTARLTVPFGDDVETFTVSFDPDTGLLQRMESMRYRGEGDTAKVLWVNEVDEWGEVDGHPVPVRVAVTWADEGSPWARLRTEAVAHNADLDAYIEADGP